MTYDCLIVGAGWAGCVLAERLANALGQKVLLVERREQIGGNACDFVDEHGIVVQKYGPHIFHTRTKAVWDYVGRFTDWNGYVHRVLAQVGDKTVYLPIRVAVTGSRISPGLYESLELLGRDVSLARLRHGAALAA